MTQSAYFSLLRLLVVDPLVTKLNVLDEPQYYSPGKSKELDDLSQQVKEADAILIVCVIVFLWLYPAVY